MENCKLKNWLISRIDKNKNYYEDTLNIPQSKNKNLSLYQKYYDINSIYDIDLELNDKITIEYIKMRIKSNTFNTELIELISSLEVYQQDNKVRELLIPNNSNRAHANFLFKEIIDCANKESNLINEPEFNEDTLIYATKPIFDKSMKEKFYEFCMNNSLKK